MRPLREDCGVERALLGLEQRIHRLRQRRVEGYLLGQRRYRQPDARVRRSTTRCLRTGAARNSSMSPRRWARISCAWAISAARRSADLNNDGFLDLVVTSLNEKPRILVNSADNGNHWLIDETGRTQEQPRRDRREGEGYDSFGPHACTTMSPGRSDSCPRATSGYILD